MDRIPDLGDLIAHLSRPDRTSQTAGMFDPVQCLRCHNGVYDLTKVEVTARYSDCTVYKTPCCGAIVDDRTWTGLPAFERVEKARWHR